jgi:hypothetical protein
VDFNRFICVKKLEVLCLRLVHVGGNPTECHVFEFAVTDLMGKAIIFLSLDLVTNLLNSHSVLKALISRCFHQ